MVTVDRKFAVNPKSGLPVIDFDLALLSFPGFGALFCNWHFSR